MARTFFSNGTRGADIKWRLTHFVVQPLVLNNNMWKRNGKPIRAKSFDSAAAIANRVIAEDK